MKKMNISGGSAGLLAIAAAFLLTGCTVSMGGFMPQDKYAYPNSNVQALGKVSAETTKVGFIIFPQMDAKLVNGTIEKAVKSKGGDFLMNYKMTFSDTFPILPIIHFVKFKVEGTAAKMTVGKQDLK